MLNERDHAQVPVAGFLFLLERSLASPGDPLRSRYASRLWEGVRVGLFDRYYQLCDADEQLKQSEDQRQTSNYQHCPERVPLHWISMVSPKVSDLARTAVKAELLQVEQASAQNWKVGLGAIDIVFQKVLFRVLQRGGPDACRKMTKS